MCEARIQQTLDTWKNGLGSAISCSGMCHPFHDCVGAWGGILRHVLSVVRAVAPPLRTGRRIVCCDGGGTDTAADPSLVAVGVCILSEFVSKVDVYR